MTRKLFKINSVEKARESLILRAPCAIWYLEEGINVLHLITCIAKQQNGQCPAMTKLKTTDLDAENRLNGSTNLWPRN